jgi:deazaflavin-dependent oxidoreductase (nitroreductase family)
MTDIKDSPIGWVARHTREYVASDGKKGHKWSGARCLVLTTTGRRSGYRRRTTLIYGTDGDRYVVVGSNGGKKQNPQWYYNLVADQRVHVQVGAEKFDAIARVATGNERKRLWRMMAKIWPEYDRYQKKVERDLPVVVLERA